MAEDCQHSREGELIETERDSHYGHFEYPGDRPETWRDTTALWVHGYWVHDWRDQYHRIQTLDLEKAGNLPEPPYHGYGYRRGARFYFLNILEELDAPGEWFLDRDSGIVYFWPPGDLQQGEVNFPQLQEPMLVLRGTQYVSVRGLIFEASRDKAMSSRVAHTTRLQAVRSATWGGGGRRHRGQQQPHPEL